MENSPATQSTTHPVNSSLLLTHRTTLVPPKGSVVDSTTTATAPASFPHCYHLSIQKIELGRVFFACPFKCVSCAAPHRLCAALTDCLPDPCPKSRPGPATSATIRVPPGRSSIGGATAATTKTSFSSCFHLSIQKIKLLQVFHACHFKS